MPFLDKFNDWYVRSIPETGSGPSVTWMEPAAGARYRWKTGRVTYFAFMAVIFALLLLPLTGKNGAEPLSMPARFVVAFAMTGLMALAGWASSHTRTRIFLGAQGVTIGTGRGARRLRLDIAHEVTLAEWDGYRVLIVAETPRDRKRIYLDPNCEGEVIDLLVKAGRLKSL